MSKVVAASAMLLGGAGTAVTGAYAVGAFNWADYEIPETFDEFKDKGLEGCIKEVFSTLEGGKKMSELLTNAQSEVTSTDTQSWTGTGEEGCLVVNWDKWKSSDKSGKWKGNFRFLWSFSKGDKGFVVYTSASTSPKSDNSAGELLVEGGAYTLTKNTTDNKWSFSKKLEVPKATDGTNKKSLGKESLSSSDVKFPKQGTALEGFDSNSFWNFLQSSDLDSATNLCGTGDECKVKGDSFRGYWTWKPKGSDPGQTQEKSLGDWSSDVDKWWQAIYDSGNSKWNMKELIKDVKGEWVKTKLSSIPKVGG